MADTFEETIQESRAFMNENDTESVLEAGDDCPEDCTKDVHKLTHERNSQLDTEPHPEAPETEVVCVHHGIVVSR